MALPSSHPTPPLDPTRQRLGWWLGLLAVALFGGTIPMTRLAAGSAADPRLAAEFVAIGRAAAAGLLALTWLVLIGAAGAGRRPARAAWPALASTAGGVVFGFPLLMGWAVRHVDAVHASVVSGLLPIGTAAVAVACGVSRPRPAFWGWALGGAAGVTAFAVWRGGGRPVAADGLLLLAVVAASWGYVQGARLSQGEVPGVPPMAAERVIAWALVLSLPLTLPWAWATRPTAPVPASAWAGFAYVALISAGLGFVAWYRALAWGGVLRTAQLQLLQPFFSLAWAVPLLGEALPPGTLGFAALVAFAAWRARRHASPANPSHLVTGADRP